MSVVHLTHLQLLTLWAITGGENRRTVLSTCVQLGVGAVRPFNQVVMTQNVCFGHANGTCQEKGRLSLY